MNKVTLNIFRILCVFIIVNCCGCGPKFIRNEWVSIRLLIDTDPRSATVFDSYGVKLGTTPYIYERKFAMQTWSDGDLLYFENKKPYELGKNETFTGIVSKDGYRRMLFEIPYKFNGTNETIRKMMFLNKE
jgi:hypothetical protein